MRLDRRELRRTDALDVEQVVDRREAPVCLAIVEDRLRGCGPDPGKRFERGGIRGVQIDDRRCRVGSGGLVVPAAWGLPPTRAGSVPADDERAGLLAHIETSIDDDSLGMLTRREGGKVLVSYSGVVLWAERLA